MTTMRGWRRAALVTLACWLVAPAFAADLPAGNCAAPKANTDLSGCDFTRHSLAGANLAALLNVPLVAAIRLLHVIGQGGRSIRQRDRLLCGGNERKHENRKADDRRETI